MINKKEKLNKIIQQTFAILFIWGTAVFAATHFGFFQLIPRQSIPLLVVIGIVVPVITYYANNNFRQLVRLIGYRRLTVLNAWRIPAGLAFLYYGSRGWLPEQFVINAGYGDIAVGILALIVLLLPEVRSKYIAVQIVGLFDFVIAVGTGLTFTILQVPLMENIATNPIVLIPLFGVPITGALHLMTLDTLFRKGDPAATKFQPRSLQTEV